MTNRVGEVAETLGDAGFYCECGNARSMADTCQRAIAAAGSYDQSGTDPFCILECTGASVQSLVGE